MKFITMKKNNVVFITTLLSMLISVGSMAQVNVTLRVDMQDENVSAFGVHVAGNFQGWSPGTTPMTLSATGSVYEHIFQANPGEQVLYKYINGNDWPDQENVPSNCGEPDGYGGYNRSFEVPNEDVVIDLVCFGACLPCNLPQIKITFQVDLSNEVLSNEGVHVAGTFNEWSTSSTELSHIGNNVYAATIELGAGEYHEYKFINGNAWPGGETVPGDCSYNNNRFYTVPAVNETIPLVCFGSCEPCTSVTDINVTFKVDMSEQEISPEGVHIAGGFQGWIPEGTLMTEVGVDVYEYTIVMQSGSYQEYKFINGVSFDEAEMVPWYCAFNGNRFFTVPENDTVMPAVCFGSCLVCNPNPVDITFQVDLSTQIVSVDGVHLAGSFQGWDPSATEMTSIGNNVYEVTLSIGEGEWHEYKFINGIDFEGAEIVSGNCANYSGNREFFVPSIATPLDLVCFGECVPCSSTLYEFDLSVMLEGPFNGEDMNTKLFDSEVLPINQPFNAEPWNYDGGEFLSAAPETEIVDWIYIQFRETDGNASTATPDKMLDHQAAVLLSDGSVARPDGSPNIFYNGNITDNLYIVIYHRNHLAVMSATPLPNLLGLYTYDFSNGLSKAYLDGQKTLGGGMYGMIGGDSDASGIVDTNDKDTNWNTEVGSAGYFGSDLSMDSQVNNPDKNDIWEPNLNVSTQVPQ